MFKINLKKKFKIYYISKDYIKFEIIGKYIKGEKYINRSSKKFYKNDNVNKNNKDTKTLSKINWNSLINTKKNTIINFTEKHVIKNMIFDTNFGFSIFMELRGLGFRINLHSNNILIFDLGLSHLIYYKLPIDIVIKFLDDKNTIFIIMGTNRERVLNTFYKIKSLKKKDAYKNKGFFLFGDIPKLKEGKQSNI